ncbi:hypothetical protein C0995_015500 [Termitomyces sp. Mi166|nr:hypothetical protein C0995_015500 [Termitomyces sp. Mi166\
MSQSSDSELYERDSQSQFVSQEGDEDVLWEVDEITAEKGRFYKVRWAGVDPQTSKPWAQSWVRKSDCTDDLVHEWKRRKLKKKNKGSKGSRLSHASRVSTTSRVSTNSSSTVTKRNIRDQSTTATPANRARGNGKRTRSTARSEEGHNEDDGDPPLAQPKKKRKLTVIDSKVAKSHPTTRRKKSPVRGSDNDYVDELEVEVTTSRQTNKEKNKDLLVKMEEEESGSDDEGIARIQPASLTTRSPSTVGRNVKPRRSSNTRTPTVTPDPDTAYVKFKSGKLSTPKKKRRLAESVRDPSSSSDEVEEVVPAHKSPTPPPTKSDDSLRTIASTTLRQLQAYHTPSLSDPHNGEDHIMQEMYDEYVDFDAAHQQPENAIRACTTFNGAKDDSYRQGEVPETETQSSHNAQSQFQSQPLVSSPKQRQPSPPRQPRSTSSPGDENPDPFKQVKQHVPAKPSRVPTLIVQQPQTPPPRSRSSLVSRMRPRTPGSSPHISLFDNGVTFHQPELEMHIEVDEEQNQPDQAETKTEQPKPASTTSSRRTSRAGSGPLRPIPRLSPSIFTLHLPSAPSSSSHRSAADSAPTEESDEAEAAYLVSSIEQFSSPEKGGRKRKIGQEKVDRKGKGKEPANDHLDIEASVTDGDDSGEDELENVVRKRGQQLAARARAERLKWQREFDGEVGEGRKKTLKEVLSEHVNRKGKKRMREEEKGEEKGRTDHAPGPRWGKEKEKLRSSRAPSEEDGEHESVEDDVADLREEEEESTQDLMMDVPNIRPMEDVEMNQGWDVEPPAQVTDEVELSESTPDPVVEKRKSDTRTRSKSKSSSHSGCSGHHKPSQDELVLPPTAPVPSPTPIEVNLIVFVNHPEFYVDDQSQEQDNRPDFVATLALLNEKSQENAQLTKEINTLREALAAASGPRPPELELERELELVRASLGAAQASLAESEKRVADLTRRKDSAEKDREFFREHYLQASGFVTSVREENAELQKEAQIAREQASTGVEAVKATYVVRVKALEDDARTFKRLALFMMEKDIRTNDDIRRRAAEEPELRARCEELSKDLRHLRNEIVDLQEEVDDKDIKIQELEQQLKSCQRQATVLNADLTKVKSLQEGEDKVYQCGWRVDDDGNVPCGQVFATYEEFERHMFSERHLDAKRAAL